MTKHRQWDARPRHRDVPQVVDHVLLEVFAPIMGPAPQPEDQPQAVHLHMGLQVVPKAGELAITPFVEDYLVQSDPVCHRTPNRADEVPHR